MSQSVALSQAECHGYSLSTAALPQRLQRPPTGSAGVRPGPTVPPARRGLCQGPLTLSCQCTVTVTAAPWLQYYYHWHVVEDASDDCALP